MPKIAGDIFPSAPNPKRSFLRIHVAVIPWHHANIDIDPLLSTRYGVGSEDLWIKQGGRCLACLAINFWTQPHLLHTGAHG